MKRHLLIAATGLALALPMSAAQAQMPVSFGILAGASMPTGDAGDFLSTGFNLGATLGFTPALVPFGVRVDGVWHQFEYDDAVADGDLSVIALTANAMFQVPVGAMPGISPYLIGGLGLYSADDAGDADRQNEFGWNIGGGLRFALAGFSTFVEARYNSFSIGEDASEQDINFIPISFGITF